jgi:hypothetical protein
VKIQVVSETGEGSLRSVQSRSDRNQLPVPENARVAQTLLHPIMKTGIEIGA